MRDKDYDLLQQTLLKDEYDIVRRMSYLALDVPHDKDAMQLVDFFGESVDGYKVGLQLFHAGGQKVVDDLLRRGKRVFLDVKLHDIPNTVAGALQAICDSPLEMVNVHALGGRRMMEAAREAVSQGTYHPLLIAVTILTSMSEDELFETGISETPLPEVQKLASLALDCKMDGVVASARELSVIKDIAHPNFETIIPGTRPKGGPMHDQRRTLTPGEAVLQGASRLVLGRAVLQAERPLQALCEIWDDMKVSLDKRS